MYTSLRFGLIGVFFLTAVPLASHAQNNQTDKKSQSLKGFPDYPIQAASAYKIAAQQGDVWVGIEPVDSVDDQTTYFHTELAPKGFLPVFVLIENRSKTESLMLNKSNIKYGQAPTGDSSPKMETAGEKTQVVTTALIPLVGIFVGLGIERNATDTKQNMILNEMRSGTIAPGKSAHGFLYIPIPRKGERPKLRVEIPIAWSGSDGKSQVNLEF